MGGGPGSDMPETQANASRQLAVAPSDGELNAFKFGILSYLSGRMTVPMKLT